MTFNKSMSLFRIAIFTAMVLMGIGLTGCNGKQSDKNLQKPKPVEISDRYREMVHAEFKDMATIHNADTRYLIIVDYSIPSNNDRLFVWDVEQDKIVEKFWCAHGCGGNSTDERPEYSNKVGSNCSSLGWYLVERWVGTSPNYGYKYHAVDGLESTNSNARRRQILIHHWSSVSYDEAAKIKRPMSCDYRSAGCFTLSDNGFQTVDRYIKSRQKRILLWAIDGVRN